MIEVKEVSKRYRRKRVLDNISLRFEEGTVYGIVGENGAGKTTLFRCMAGLESFEGTVTGDLHPLKDHLGFLPTDPWFFPRITGREYIRLLCRARDVRDDDTDEKNLFGLPLDQYAGTYSTGMKKKLALMAVLMQPNRYLLLDEPFNGVDLRSNLLITEIIRKLKDRNRTVLISSHIFSTLTDTCDEIILLQEGRIVRRVGRTGFGELEKEMRSAALGDATKIDRIIE